MGTNLFEVLPMRLQRGDRLNEMIAWLNTEDIDQRTKEVHLTTWAMAFSVQLTNSDYIQLTERIKPNA